MKDRIRKPGAGRQRKEQEVAQLSKKFDKVIASHTAGCPVKGVRWTYLNIEEIRQKLANKGLSVCREVVYRLLNEAHLGSRKMTKQKTMKAVRGRNEQFIRIEKLKKYYLSRRYAVLSIDVKKKEHFGAFYRTGRVYSSTALPCYDHDFNSFSNGRMVPQGIYDLGRNEGFLFLGASGDTAQFSTECLRRWWNKQGNKVYCKNRPVLILCDGGGSNGSRNNLFKAEMQKLANETGLRFRLAHYPAYCSKYNPIEHRLFPTVSRTWSGIMLDSLKTAKKLVNNRTTNLKSGLRITTQIIQGIFLTGKKLQEGFWDNCNIVFDKILPSWNYRICPIS